MPPRNGIIVVIAGHARSLVHFRKPLLAAFATGGRRVVALAPNIEPETAAALDKLGVEHRAVPFHRAQASPLMDLRSLAALTRVLRELRPEIVFAYTLKPAIYGSIAARRAGVARTYSMITGLGYAFSGNSIRQQGLQRLILAMLRLALRSNDSVFVQNHDDLRLLQDARVLRDGTSAVVVGGSGVDLHEYAFAPPPPGPISFLFMGRLLREKGVYDFVEAARRVRTRFPDSQFRILGRTDENPGSVTVAELKKWDTEGVISYLGFSEDVRPYLREASVLVLPSYYREGLPRSILEAMATGRPVITTDAPGCREAVMDGETGLLVPTRAPSALADAMQRFVQSPDLLISMGLRARHRAEERFGVHRIARAIVLTMQLSISEPDPDLTE